MIELKEIHKTYVDKKGRDVHALKGVSFRFPKKGVVFIVGKSGSGKSTMLNLLGLLDDYESGELIINDKSSKNFSEQERDAYRALNIGFVFQEFHIIEKYTIGQNVSLALEIGQQIATKEQIASALEKVGLENYENRFGRNVSGGQKQRVAIARAIVKKPKIVLADEPTGNLDSVTSREIFELMRELSKESLVIVISHDMESAHRYADKILELSDGEISDVYSGDGTSDTVRLSVEKVDKEQVDKLLDEGKKVILVKNKKQEGLIETAETPPQMDIKTKVKIPFKSSLKLSFLFMRAKWIRMAFTIILAVFAIGIFGIADVVGGYDVNRLMAEELENTGLPFVSIALYEIPEETLQRDGELSLRTSMLSRDIEKFSEMNLSFYYQRFFPYRKFARHMSYTEYLHGTFWDPWTNFVEGSIELEDPSQLGLNLSAGRWPNDTSEVVITNFMFRRYQTFGISLISESNQNANEYLWGSHQVWDEGNLPSGAQLLSSFSQIEEREIWPEIMFEGRLVRSTRPLRIVGMIDFDISKYEPILIYRPHESTREARNITRELLFSRNIYLNSFFALSRFYEDFMQYTVGSQVPPHIFENLIEHSFGAILVPANTHAERMNVLQTLEQHEGILRENTEGEEVLFNFVVWTFNANTIHRIDGMFGLFTQIFALAAILFAVFSVFLLYSFIASSISSRKKDIGILRSLGASRFDTARIFINEGVLIAILSIILASILCFLGYFFLDMFFLSNLGAVAETYTLISFGIRQIFLMSAVTIAGVAAAIFLPILKIARKQPVAVIRENVQ
ncbi:MAG: ABC transporter ATP-binding protein/permease [Firmicutes bacterium]|nr:ABC transporter ATP-binding protein/permease [Bacillota bacterium]